MKLNYKRTLLIGLAFLSISAFWQMYDNIIPLILKNTFQMKETMTVMYAALQRVAPAQLRDADGVLDDKKVLYGLEKLVAADPEGAASLLPELLKKEVVACSEVGSGVIPLRYEQRQAREATGRLCVQLAAHAEKVIRMVAGIPVTIKGA